MYVGGLEGIVLFYINGTLGGIMGTLDQVLGLQVKSVCFKEINYCTAN